MFREKLEEKDIVAEVLEDFHIRQQERKSFEAIWQLNINFFVGNQYCYISPNGEIMDSSKQYFWQEREVYNHIANIIEIRQSKLSRVRPALTVIPFSDDESDVACAKTSKKILKAVSHNKNMSKILSQGTMWSEICGTAFYKIDWDNMGGKVVGKDNMDNFIREGDVAISVVSPFEIYPDSNTYNNIDDCMSIIYARTFHKDMVKNIWGVDCDGEDINVYTLDSISTAGGLGYTTMSTAVAKKLKKEQVLVLEKYEKPTIENPNGRLTIVAGDKLIFMGELPYINKNDGKRGFPFVKQSCIVSPNCFWGSSIVERCIPIQRSYNAIKNRKHEFLNRLTMGILSVEDGSLDIENLEEEGLSPGKVLIYRQGANAPRMLSSDSVPIDFQYEENSLLNEFATVSGVSDLLNSRGVSSSNASGIALQLLIEQDDIKLLSSAEEIKNAAKDMAKHILRLYKQFALMEHTTRIVGDNGAIELFYWRGSDINSEEIVFETESEINETLAQKRSMIFEILNAGLLMDENGRMSNSMRSKILEQLGFGVWETSQDMNALQINSANKENIAFVSKLKSIVPKEIDDHKLHINEHIAFMLSSDYERSASKNSKIEDLMLEHIRSHKKYLTITNQIEKIGE
ncbi:MAG: hypothetical protein E7354_00890 [Clostridiales bacterium]|nr:hypothetical protein [Clostridiales bacterium]